jgi:hypothetical protein
MAVALFAVAVIFIGYRLIVIRTVNYEIGGIKIPSKYNILTGKVTPIKEYKGGDIKRVVEDRKIDPREVGLSADEVMGAKVRWAIFEQWVKERAKYKGWESDPEVFKKAQDDFLKELEASRTKVTLVK